MSQQTHPKLIRIKGVKDWSSRGVDISPRKIAGALREDFVIRRFLQKTLAQAMVEDIEIERAPSSLKIIIKTARPGLIIGRGGEGVERLRKTLEKTLVKAKIKANKEMNSPAPKGQGIPSAKFFPPAEIKIDIQEVKNYWASPNLCAAWIAQQLEKRMPYRRCLKMALSKIMANKEVKGARAQVAGRLNGIEISRTEWLKEGQLPRQSLRADILYGFARAFCTYGVIGVKVWIYKGEKFE